LLIILFTFQQIFKVKIFRGLHALIQSGFTL
jgi:hypothetical protein